MAKLIITTSQGEETLELGPDLVVTVGRDPSNRVPLPDDNQASRRHCRIGPREGGVEGWEVVDLGSTNKTRVGGQPVNRRVLQHGDVVEVGHARLRFLDEAEAEREASAAREGTCYLEWATKERRGEKVLLSKPRVTIGRRETNTVILDDRMASGHHAEIDRDVNGYTIRDLGSTNGTMVNGELITEALLSHGARVRIGNSRFVFKDPSMKDIEVELSHFEEDEGWGMMGELDLSRAPGSRSGLLLVLLLFLAAAAGGVYLAQQGEQATGQGQAAARGLLANGSFEEAEVAWSAADPERAEVARRAGSGRGSSGGLVLAATGGEDDGAPVLVSYEELFETTAGRPLRLSAALQRRGEAPADLVVVWSSNPTADEMKASLVTAMERLDVVLAGSSGWQTMDRVLATPAWARAARIGVQLAPGARAVLDDVRLEYAAEEAAGASLDVPSYKKAYVDPAGRLDLVQSRVVLLTAARPVARLADGRTLDDFRRDGPPQAGNGEVVLAGGFERGPEAERLPCRVTWRANPEGLSVEVVCEGAEAVGLTALLPVVHLGGTVSVLGAFPAQAIPAEAGQHLEHVSRCLAGEAEASGNRPPTLMAFTQPGDEARATLDLFATATRDLLEIRHVVAGPELQMGIVTDFGRQREGARQDLAAAKGLMTTNPAAAFEALRTVAASYPFVDEVRDEALRQLGELEDRVLADVRGLEDSLQRFRIYQSPAAFDDLQARTEALAAQFLSHAETDGRRGPIVQRIEELVGQAREAQASYRIEQALPGLDRLERLVGLLADQEGYRPVAAVYARTLIDRYGGLAEASPEVDRRLEAARERLEKLLKSESVREAVPPEPQ